MQNKIIKSGVLLLAVLFPFLLNAQNNTYSPYSRYGIGDIFRKPFGPYRAMGGTSVGLRIPNSINFYNPASYSTQDSLSFIFDFGLRYSNDMYRTSDMKRYITNINLDHLAISFPITVWWYSSAGIFPYSNVGYDIYEERITAGSVLQYKYIGNGGLNQFYLGNAFMPIQNLSIGINLSLLFGNIEYIREINCPDEFFLATVENRKSIVRDIFMTYGIQYTCSFNKIAYSLGVTFDNQKEMKTTEDYYLIHYPYRFGWDFDQNDTLSIAYDTARYYNNGNGSITLPNNFGIGFSLNHNDKIIAAFDYSTQQWSAYEFSGRNDHLQNSHYFSFGIDFTPDKYSIKSYLALINYRMGAHYYKTNLELNNTRINDYGFSFGLGLPLKNRKTKLNVTYEWGIKGTTNNDLMEQNYNIVSLSISLYDRWFVKSKFD